MYFCVLHVSVICITFLLMVCLFLKGNRNSNTRKITKKLAPCGIDGRQLLQARRRSDEKNFRKSHLNFLPSSKSCDTKTRI